MLTKSKIRITKPKILIKKPKKTLYKTLSILPSVFGGVAVAFGVELPQQQGQIGD